MSRSLLAWGCLITLTACQPAPERAPRPVDVGVADARATAHDAAAHDAAAHDAAAHDAAPHDAAVHDAAAHDAAPSADGALQDVTAASDPRDSEPPVDLGGVRARDAAPPDAAPPVVPPSPSEGPAARYGYVVRAQYPHDAHAFTQGLVYLDGLLYESTGLRGQSTVRVGRLGQVASIARRALDGRYFGEGLAAVGDRLVQLTWQSGIGFVYDRATLAPLGEFHYPGEGWGLAYDGARLIMSDGTARLRFLDPETFVELGGVEVRDGGVPVTRLNELEVIGGEVFANIWLTDRIARIDPRDGRVRGWVDLSGLRPAEAGDVLNGIAWDAEGERLLVTGKLWPAVYDVRLVPRAP